MLWRFCSTKLGQFIEKDDRVCESHSGEATTMFELPKGRNRPIPNARLHARLHIADTHAPTRAYPRALTNVLNAANREAHSNIKVNLHS